jgi:hypothetical protein
VTSKRFTIDRDFGFIDVDFHPDLCHRFAVDFNSTVRDQFIDLATRSKAGCGEKFVDSLFTSKYGRRFSTRTLGIGHGWISD